jgi:hypothetical protein
MKIDENLKEKLTKDRTARELYENYGSNLEKGTERCIGDERYIKLNRLERKEEPMKIRHGDFNNLYCPVCGNKFEAWVQLDPYCGKCGQRIQL